MDTRSDDLLDVLNFILDLSSLGPALDSVLLVEIIEELYGLVLSSLELLLGVLGIKPLLNLLGDVLVLVEFLESSFEVSESPFGLLHLVIIDVDGGESHGVIHTSKSKR